MREGPQAIDSKADPPASGASTPALTFGTVDAIGRRQSGQLVHVALARLNRGRINGSRSRLLILRRLIGAAELVEQAPQVSFSHFDFPCFLGVEGSREKVVAKYPAALLPIHRASTGGVRARGVAFADDRPQGQDAPMRAR